MDAPKDFLKVYLRDMYLLAELHQESRVDAAVSEYLGSGCTRDSILPLELVDGSTFSVRASIIESWFVSTAESRRCAIEQEKAWEDERLEMRREAGIFEKDS